MLCLLHIPRKVLDWERSRDLTSLWYQGTIPTNSFTAFTNIRMKGKISKKVKAGVGSRSGGNFKNIHVLHIYNISYTCIHIHILYIWNTVYFIIKNRCSKYQSDGRFFHYLIHCNIVKLGRERIKNRSLKIEFTCNRNIINK